MFGNVYGLDLGTYEIKVYDKKQDAVWKEKNAVAIANKRNILSVGDTAYEMFEKAPFNIEVRFPMKEGVISHFYDMQFLLQNLLKKEQRFNSGSKYIVAVPADVTEVEKRAFFDLVVHSTAKAKEVRIVERAIADSIGLGLDVEKTTGIFMVNFGGETTELSVLSYGGVVLNKMLKIGGRTMDQTIVNSVRSYDDYLIGKQTAEELRKTYGICGSVKEDKVVAGRNLVSGVPELKGIPVDIVRSSMTDCLNTLTNEIKFMLDRTPPEIQRYIQRKGIHFTGGVSNLNGLSEYFEDKLGIKIHVSKTPEYSTVNGLKDIIQTKALRKYTYSMLDENYRWMR